MFTASQIALGYQKGAQYQRILEQVSFEVAQGELTCLLGSSGVGKSSLLRVLAGLEAAECGNVTLFGMPITQPNAEIGFVFQSPTLLPWLTVKQNVAFGLNFACREKRSAAEIQSRVAQALEEVGLQDFAHAMPHELSGGMAQRVNLARAVAREPKVILLDEPFSALDPALREQMQQLLLAIIQQHQSAAVMITHDIDEALNVANQILLLGKPQEKDPAQIIGRWQVVSPFPRDLLPLNAIRLDILHTLRHRQQRARQESSLEYLI